METSKYFKFASLLLLAVTSSLSLAGEFSAKVLSTTIQGSTVGASIQNTDLDYVPLKVTADGTNPSTRARAVIDYEVVYTPSPGESVTSPIYVTVGFEDVLEASSSSNSALVCDVTDGVTVVHSISPSYFAAENGAAYGLGESEVAVPVALQTDGTWKGSFTVASNYLEAHLPSGGSGTASATQGVYLANYAFSPSSIPPVRQRSLAGSGGATFFKVTSISFLGTKDPDVFNAKYTLKNIVNNDPKGKLYSRAATLTEGNYSMFERHGFGFSGNYVQFSCNVFTTRASTYPTSATIEWSINTAKSLAASGTFGDPMGSEYCVATIGSKTITATRAGSTQTYKPSPVITPKASFTVSLDSVGSANFVIPSGNGLLVPLLSVGGGASVNGTSMSATAYHALRLNARVK